MAKMSFTMGEVRSRMSGKPGSATWRKTARLLSSWPDDEDDVLLREVVPHCREQLLTWPARSCQSPPRDWGEKWMNGSRRHGALVGLAFLDETKHPRSGTPERERCSYYVWSFAEVEMLSHAGDYDCAHFVQRTADENILDSAIGGACDNIRDGHSALANDLFECAFASVSSDTLAVYLNGVLLQTVDLMPDLVFRDDKSYLRVRYDRRSIHTIALNRSPWRFSYAWTVNVDGPDDLQTSFPNFASFGRSELYEPFKPYERFDTKAIAFEPATLRESIAPIVGIPLPKSDLEELPKDW